MAAKPAPVAEPVEGEAPKKTKKKMMMFIIIGVVVVVLLAGGGALLLMKKKAKAAEGEDPAVAEASGGHEGKAKVTVDKTKPPVFVPFEPFTANLKSETGEQYVQLAVTFRAADAHLGEEIKLFTPEIRHKVLLLLSGKTAPEITSPEGRESLANEICLEANSALGYEPETPPKPKKGEPAAEPACSGPVVSVLFTSFIVQ